MQRTAIVFSLFSSVLFLGVEVPAGGQERTKVLIESTFDQSQQPCYVILPHGYQPGGKPVPLLVSLHSWSAGVEQRNLPLEKLSAERGWIYLFPHFRGPNQHPDACGSLKAQQDILDAVAWAKQQYAIDARRIYLTGVSGGGHMTMLMAGRHPEVWAAASAWVGISDLAAWHKKHAAGRYGEMMRKSCGGPPGLNAEVDRQYRDRSPLTHLHRATKLPLDIAAGIHDGHTGSVPIRQSLEAFNTIATALKEQPVSQAEIEQLSRRNGRLAKPLASDQVRDPSLGREIHLRRQAGNSRVTIFEGGHEGVASAAVDWLSRHAKQDP